MVEQKCKNILFQTKLQTGLFLTNFDQFLRSNDPAICHIILLDCQLLLLLQNVLSLYICFSTFYGNDIHSFEQRTSTKTPGCDLN